MVLDKERLAEILIKRAQVLGRGCEKVFAAISGGIDSALVSAILTKAFGPENVVGLYRNIKSNPKHLEDVKFLQSTLGFKLINIDGNPLYDEFVRQVKDQFDLAGLPWADEGTSEADELGFTNSFASLKSRLTTPMAGFISKAIDGGKGRVFGTGNGEEDGILRYFDKYGDGAVDSNLLCGLTKAEVRQMAIYFGVPMKIVTKLPSADLEANGDDHNDESQLTEWARKLGYDIKISYGASDGSSEGNIAWAWKEDIKEGVITGDKSEWLYSQLKGAFEYSDNEVKIILFLRHVERNTRHKVELPYGVERAELLEFGVVDR